MTTTTFERAWWPSSSTPWIVAGGIALGLIYTLSPFTVLVALAVIPLLRWAVQGTDGRERRWVMAVLIAAIAARLLVVLALFLMTDHQRVPFGHLFGDEEYFIRRSLWIRNLALGVPLHRADFIYAYDDYSRTSFLYVLALLQVLFGPAPYGAHLFSILCYVAASIVLFRLVRSSFGPVPAFIGLVLLLFLPTQFAWSLSALKDPLYLLVMSVSLSAALALAQSGTYLKRGAALGVLIVAAIVAQSIRQGGLAMVGAGAVGGLAFGLIARRPRAALVVAVLLLLTAPLVVTRGTVQDRVVAGMHQVASVHWGHVNTAGYVYTFMDGSFYQRKASIDQMTFRQGIRYLAGSLVSYVIVPLPWKIQSRAALSYLPEQMVWYFMVLLAPVGFVAGLRRDALLTCLLLGYTTTAALLVAITSGNVGTLVRHRGLAVPYLMWFSVLGAVYLIGRLTDSRRDIYGNH